MKRWRRLYRPACASMLAVTIVANAVVPPARAAQPDTVATILARERGLDETQVRVLRQQLEIIRARIAPQARILGHAGVAAIPDVSGPVVRAAVGFLLRTVVFRRLEGDVDRIRHEIATALEREGAEAVARRLGSLKHPAVSQLVATLRSAGGAQRAGRAVERFLSTSLAQVKSGLLSRADVLAAGGLSESRALLSRTGAGEDALLIGLAAVPIDGRPSASAPPSSALDWLFVGDNLRKALVALAVVSGVALAIYLGVVGGVIAPFVTLLGALGAIIGLLTPKAVERFDLSPDGPAAAATGKVPAAVGAGSPRAIRME